MIIYDKLMTNTYSSLYASGSLLITLFLLFDQENIFELRVTEKKKINNKLKLSLLN